MPSRVLQGAILSSESLARVSIEAEALFWRLILAADDYGRLDGRLPVLRAAVFATRDVSLNQLGGWLSELESADSEGQGPVLRYVISGRQYIQLVNWEQHRSQWKRGGKSKFPAHTEHEFPRAPADSRGSPSEDRGSRIEEREQEGAKSERGSAEGEPAAPAKAARSAPQTSRRSARPRAPFPAALSDSERSELGVWVEEQIGAGKLGARWRGEVELREAIDRCRDWHRGRGKLIADPVAVLRNWLRRERIGDEPTAQGRGSKRLSFEEEQTRRRRIALGLDPETGKEIH